MLASLMFLRLEQLLKGRTILTGPPKPQYWREGISLKKDLNWRHFTSRIVLVNIYLIMKSVVQPLKALSEGAERIDAGKFDYARRQNTTMRWDDWPWRSTQSLDVSGITRLLSKKARKVLSQRPSSRPTWLMGS